MSIHQHEVEVEVLCGVMLSSGIWCTESDGGSRECGGDPPPPLAKTRANGERDEVEESAVRVR